MSIGTNYSEPIRYDQDRRAWVITSHTLGLTALHNPLLTTRSPDANRSEQDPHDPMGLVFRQAMLHDGDPHLRIRSVLEAAIKRKVGLMQSLLQQLIPMLFQQPHTGPHDIRSIVAAPLPLLSLAHLLGIVSLPDWEETVSSSTALEPLLTKLAPWEQHLQAFGDLLTGFPSISALAGARQLHYDVGQLLQFKRLSPGDDLATLCASDPVFACEDERISNLIMMFGAGSGTTTTLLLNGPVFLLLHPTAFADLCNLLQENPGHATAVLRNVEEELLRLVTPTQMVARWALDRVTLGGQHLHAGDKVILDLASMNRDPSVFVDPDQLILRRHNARSHLAFGSGAHGCPGRPLALLETLETLKQLLVLPNLRLVPGQTFTFGYNRVQQRLERALIEWSNEDSGIIV